MPETTNQTLSTISETLLLPVYVRAMESQRPDALIKDDKALELVRSGSLDFSHVQQIRMNELLHVMRLIFTRQFDRYTRDFINHHQEAVVVNIGCGLDSRCERVAEHNERVEWFDLDLPEVINLRRKYLGTDKDNYRLLSTSVLEEAWMEMVKVYAPRPFLFLAETVFVYFTEEQVKSLLLRLRAQFPGAELVFDGWKPFEIWLGNRFLSNSPFTGLMRWGLWNEQQVEGWGDGIQLVDEWGFFDQTEPRLKPYRWIAPLFRLLKPMRIFHFQLGKTAVL